MKTESWVKALREKIRRNGQIAKPAAETVDRPFLSVGEASRKLGVSTRTLYTWIQEGVIPKPRRWGKASTRPFRKEYVQALRDQLIVRNSSLGYWEHEDLRRLGWRQLFGVR